MQCRNTDGDGLRILSKQSDHPSGDQPAQRRTGSHDPGSQFQCQTVDLLHTLSLTGTVVIADQGADALNDTVGRQVNKGL